MLQGRIDLFSIMAIVCLAELLFELEVIVSRMLCLIADLDTCPVETTTLLWVTQRAHIVSLVACYCLLRRPDTLLALCRAGVQVVKDTWAGPPKLVMHGPVTEEQYWDEVNAPKRREERERRERFLESKPTRAEIHGFNANILAMTYEQMTQYANACSHALCQLRRGDGTSHHKWEHYDGDDLFVKNLWAEYRRHDREIQEYCSSRGPLCPETGRHFMPSYQGRFTLELKHEAERQRAAAIKVSEPRWVWQYRNYLWKLSHS